MDVADQHNRKLTGGEQLKQGLYGVAFGGALGALIGGAIGSKDARWEAIWNHP